MHIRDQHASFIATEYVRRLGELALFRIEDQRSKAFGRRALSEIQRWTDVENYAVRLMGRYYRMQQFKRRRRS